jgi:cilia- and flagella-associated protein 57
VSTDTGDLILIDSFEVKGTIHYTKTPEEQTPINCICSFAKGFICGAAGGVMRIFERFEDTRELYKCTKLFRIQKSISGIVSMAVSPQEETLVCSTDDYQIYTFTLSNVDILKEDAVPFEYLTAGFHGPGDEKNAKITGIDVCVWKPIVITAGVDKSVRVWNYHDRTSELVTKFQREVHSVALHPSGLYCLLGFPEGLKLCSIFVNDIRPFFEVNIKSCHECRFSWGGSYFAAVSNSLVQVHATYSGELVSTLKGHSGKVKSIAWKSGDRRIVTSSIDGSIIVWNVMRGLKEAEHNQLRVSFHCCVVSTDMMSCLAAGSDAVVRHFEIPVLSAQKNELLSLTEKGEIPLDCHVSSMALTANQKMVFIGTCDDDKPGRVRAKAIGPQLYGDPFLDIYCHSGPVTKLKLTLDGTLLFSGGGDGALCIFEVATAAEEDKEKSRQVQHKSKEHREGEGQFGEEILVTKADLEEQSKVMAKLRNKVEELSLNNEYQLRLKDLNYKDKIKVSVSRHVS